MYISRTPQYISFFNTAAMASYESFSTRPTIPFLFRLRSSKTTIVSVITLAVWTDTFLYSVIVPVLPFALDERVGVPEHNTQRYVSLLLATYALGIMLFSPICGYLADRYPSRQGPFLLGLIVLAGANLLLCFGKSLLVLFAGRFLQGGAAAAVWSVGYAMIPETVESERAGTAIGLVNMGSGLGLLLGPAAGGWVYDKWGYYAVFEMSFGVLAIDVVFRSLLIERKTAERIEWKIKRWEDQINEGDTVSSSDSTEVSENLVDIVQPDDEISKSQAHRFPIGLLLSTPRLLSAMWGMTVFAMLLTSFDGVLTLFVNRTFDWGSTEAGLILLVISISTPLDPFFGHLSDKYGRRLLSLIALAGAIPSCALLLLVQTNSIGSKVTLGIALAMIGLGVCMGITPLTAEFSAVVDEYKILIPGVFGEGGAFAQCFALSNVAFAMGSLLGPIWGGFMAETYGFGAMGLSLAALCCVSLVPTYLFCGKQLEPSRIKGVAVPATNYGTI